MIEKEQRMVADKLLLYTATTKNLPEGPWTEEPDYDYWHDDGLDCVILRAGIGHLCGYVLMEVEHPWANAYYSASADYYDLDTDTEVHGGVTFFGIPTWAENERVAVGFACAHAGDLVPSNVLTSMHGDPRWTDVYRNMAYVKTEVEALAKQVKAARPIFFEVTEDQLTSLESILEAVQNFEENTREQYAQLLIDTVKDMRRLECGASANCMLHATDIALLEALHINLTTSPESILRDRVGRHLKDTIDKIR